MSIKKVLGSFTSLKCEGKEISKKSFFYLNHQSSNRISGLFVWLFENIDSDI